MTTGHFVGIIVALALLSIGYLIFSAEPPAPFVAKPITSGEQFDFMTDCLAEKSSTYPGCERKWFMIVENDNR